MYSDTTGTGGGIYRITIYNTADNLTRADTYDQWPAYDYTSKATRRIRENFDAWTRRFSPALRRIVDSIRELREAFEKAERARVPRELYVVPVFFLRIGPSQSALAPLIRARACARQAVPSRTRRKLRTWER
jgi:hypothetical protein